MEEIMNKCNGGSDSKVIYSPLRISTITICFNFNQDIPLMNLKKELGNKINIKYIPGSKKSKIQKKKGSDTFYNSFDLKLSVVDFTQNIFSNVSVFIFPNGKVKIAGIKTINTINILIEELIDILVEFNKFEKELIAENIKIQMICSDFKIKPNIPNNYGWCIKQEILKNILVKEYSLSATFSPLSRYPGINVKKESIYPENKPVSLLIFRSGCIIITGAKNTTDLIDSYNIIIDIIRDNSDKLFYFDINEEIKQQKKIQK
jgi:TATA-box binding protein (TBP) (component of TFIID and TFIIIB)